MAYTTIDNPEEYFKTVLYSADASTNVSVTVGHQPDWVWIKRRNGAADHVSFDSVRGTQDGLFPDLNNAEATEGGSRGLTSFDSNGFTIGPQLQDIAGSINAPSGTYVSWNWKAGTSFSNDASATSIGDIDSSGSVSQTSGFSICSYGGSGSSGDTIKHGLNTAPKIIIIKKRSATDNWTMLNTNISLNTHLHLNTTDSAVSDPMFTNTAPTTSVFTVDSDGQVNESGHTFIAYCFSEVKGYSKFGAYTGNNNNDGNFVFLGFRPAWILFKSSDSGQHWHLIDNTRETFNDSDAAQLSPNNNSTESTVRTDRGTASVDFLSNGFKLRSDGSSFNGTNAMIYMAFAEAPFVNSNGVPCNAR